MVLTTIPWRTGRAGRGVTDAAAAERDVRVRPLRRHGWAAATQDRFLDVIVLLSVLMFLALATGVGALVLQATWPR